MKRRIATVGMFDGVHSGHRLLLDNLVEAGRRKGLSPIAVTFSGHPLSCLCPGKEPKMLLPLRHKHEKLLATGVDDVVVLDFDHALQALTARDFMEMLSNRYAVEAVMMGFNNRFGSDRLNTLDDYRNAGKSVGIEVLQGPEYPGVSSTIIRNLIADKNIKQANSALGYRYFIEGVVVAGKQIGRTIGFPTANIDVSDTSLLIPPTGVYAAIATLPDNRRVGAMVNIGRRPTIDTPDAPQSIEAHLFDCDENLYGDSVIIEFVDYIREEQRFDSLDSLVAQLQADASTTRSIIATLREP